MKLMKLLRHLTNTPVAIALAFLLVGAPGAPMAKFMPSSSEAHAIGPSDDRRDPWEPAPDCNDPSNYNECFGAPGWIAVVFQAVRAAAGKVLDVAVKVTALIAGWVVIASHGFFDWIGDRWEDIKDNAEEIGEAVDDFCREHPLMCQLHQPPPHN